MLFGFTCMADAGENNGGTSTLTQASSSRLRENSRNWPKFLLELSLRQRALV